MKLRYMLPLLIVSLVPALVVAETPEQRGKAIAEEADRRDLGWNDNKSVLKMVLKNRHGQESSREMRRLVLESTERGKGDKSLVIFDAPGDIRGTALLSHTKILDSDDQWLYLPALKRIKRISSANKSGPFVGSEFAYEDLLSQEVDKYSYKWLRDESCGDLECFVVERYPVYKDSGYARQVVWWDKVEYRIHKIDFYDRKNALLKTLIYEDYRPYLDKYWRADLLKMTNHQTGKSTDLLIETWKFRVGQNVSLFTPARLKRVR